jgi:hypothetical protein
MKFYALCILAMAASLSAQAATEEAVTISSNDCSGLKTRIAAGLPPSLFGVYDHADFFSFTKGEEHSLEFSDPICEIKIVSQTHSDSLEVISAQQHGGKGHRSACANDAQALAARPNVVVAGTTLEKTNLGFTEAFHAEAIALKN